MSFMRNNIFTKLSPTIGFQFRFQWSIRKVKVLLHLPCVNAQRVGTYSTINYLRDFNTLIQVEYPFGQFSKSRSMLFSSKSPKDNSDDNSEKKNVEAKIIIPKEETEEEIILTRYKHKAGQSTNSVVERDQASIVVVDEKQCDSLDQSEITTKCSKEGGGKSRQPQKYLLKEEDIEEQFVRGSGPGGQKINRAENCVHLHHKPTGLRVKCQEFRSLRDNRKHARTILTDKLSQHFFGENSRLGRREAKAKRRKARKKRKQKTKYSKDGEEYTEDEKKEKKEE